MPKRLLFINSSLSDGGSEKAMVLVAQAMADLGYDVDINFGFALFGSSLVSENL